MANKEIKEKRCIKCRKLLIDEMLLCRRCKLEARNIVCKIANVGLVAVGGAIVAVKNFSGKPNDDETGDFDKEEESEDEDY